LVWKADETPRLGADVSHRGKRELTRVGPYQLECDGKWYVESPDDRGTARKYDPRVFGPGKDYRDIEFPLDGRWREKRTGYPLVLAPGRHRVRLAFDATAPADDTAETVRMVTDEAHTHVLALGQELTDEQWLVLAAGSLPGSRYTADQVAAIYRESHGEDLPPEELAKLYAERAIRLAQTAPDPAVMEDAMERALAFEQETETEAQLFIYLGDAHWRQTSKYSPPIWGRQRRIAAEAYMTGLGRLLKHDLPAERPELPVVGRGSVWGSPEQVEAFRLKNAEQMAARQEAMRIRELVKLRQVLTGQVVQMYARKPDRPAELRALVLRHLDSGAAAQQMIDAVEAYRRNTDGQARRWSSYPALSLSR
jgi:hypothetical protein